MRPPQGHRPSLPFPALRGAGKVCRQSLRLVVGEEGRARARAQARGASPACPTMRPGGAGAGAGAAGAPAEGAVRPMWRRHGKFSPSCRRLGPPAGEGLSASPTAPSCLAHISRRAAPSPLVRALPADSRPPPPPPPPPLGRSPRPRLAPPPAQPLASSPRARVPPRPYPPPAMLSFQYPDVYRDETAVSTPAAPTRLPAGRAAPAPPAAACSRLPQASGPRRPCPPPRPLFARNGAGGAGLLPSAGARLAVTRRQRLWALPEISGVKGTRPGDRGA
jgi:hypothetical protein